MSLFCSQIYNGFLVASSYPIKFTVFQICSTRFDDVQKLQHHTETIPPPPMTYLPRSSALSRLHEPIFQTCRIAPKCIVLALVHMPLLTFLLSLKFLFCLFSLGPTDCALCWKVSPLLQEADCCLLCVPGILGPHALDSLSHLSHETASSGAGTHPRTQIKGALNKCLLN